MFENRNIALAKTKDWQGVQKDCFELIVWDLRYTKNSLPVMVGGREGCSHESLDKDNRCDCGAFVGHLLDASLETYTQRILTLLATSPSKDLTIFITPRIIHPESILKNSMLKTPKFKIYSWVSKAGSNYNRVKQGQLYLIVASASGNFLPHSEILINPKMFDTRLLTNYSPILYINPVSIKDMLVGDNLIYLTDQEYIYERFMKTF